MTISKLNDSGDIEWYKEYSHYGTRKVQVCIVGNHLYLSGRTNNIPYNYLLYCLTLEGDIIWKKEYGKINKSEWSPGLLLTHDSNMILYDATDRNQNHPYEWLPLLIKINLLGDSITEFSFNEDYEATSIYKLIESTKHDLLVSYIYCPNACFLDLKAGVICLDSLGTIKWNIDFPYSYSPYGCVLAQIDSNTLAVKWYLDNKTIPNHDLTPPAIFFADMSGNILDTVVFQNQTLKEIASMEPIWEKGIVGCGHEYPNYINLPSPRLFGWLFRMDENRELLWERSYLDSTYQGSSFGLQHIIPTSDGGYLATGTITNWMTGVWESHNWLLKLDSLGCLRPGCGNINYITDTKEAVFLKGKDIMIYPNPANDFVRIVFPEDFDLREGVHVVLFANSGGIVRQQKISAKEDQLDLWDIASGAYYVIIRRGNEVVTSKRIVVHR
jgi:hypothetical protein